MSNNNLLRIISAKLDKLTNPKLEAWLYREEKCERDARKNTPTPPSSPPSPAYEPTFPTYDPTCF
jgi:hypothetical protein